MYITYELYIINILSYKYNIHTIFNTYLIPYAIVISYIVCSDEIEIFLFLIPVEVQWCRSGNVCTLKC